ncbi:zinc finger CCCH domain-containing protein 14-like [Punica granatum]|uniref:C3H1-type domain-containing protein n=2 Tax=Punica granatum TaxID=22663 RepID=A0A218VWN5_PUNGR|nr:zinc finger CCCH domain-containing protein 14-like [Punica granatum]OWM64411.1 hypothetical protein CDL15_Pgr020378 [Punica granatum]PKI56767.1 hypothetical protein CRG98_022828 [Punica granatum]
MEKDSSTPSDPSSGATSSSPPSQPPVAPHSPPPLRALCSPLSHQFGADFTTLYRSIFPPKSPRQNSVPASPSPCSSASSADDHRNTFNSCNYSSITIENRLQQASLVLEYQQLCERYDLCRAHLHDLVEEIDSIRRENAALRLANKELVKLLSLSSQAAMHNCLRRLGLLEASSVGSDFGVEEFSGYSPTSVMDQGRFERRNTERVWLPKSISVRSNGYLKANQPANGNNSGSGSSQSANQLRDSSAHEAGKGQQRVHLPGAKKEEAFEGYSQGMFKTELCNKWQETGTCPYGDNCQFAHGIAELRPVIRHPRYKTEVCRMILSGDSCPYGHRCHFRHSLTEQETMLAPR